VGGEKESLERRAEPAINAEEKKKRGESARKNRKETEEEDSEKAAKSGSRRQRRGDKLTLPLVASPLGKLRHRKI